MPVSGANPGALRAVQERAARKALLTVAVKVVNEARTIAPVDTGTLRQRITFAIDGTSPRNMVARVGSNVKHSIYVSLGTRPHIIRPRRAKALRFKGKGGIQFAAIVHHPGTKANDYLVRALRAVRP